MTTARLQGPSQPRAGAWQPGARAPPGARPRRVQAKPASQRWVVGEARLSSPSHLSASAAYCWLAGIMMLTTLGLAAVAATAFDAVAAQASSAPYKPGATTEPGWSWECQWQHDVSTVQVYNLGCAGAKPKTQKNEDQHASAEACERWCCETKHLKVGPEENGGAQGYRTDVATDPPCDFWQWADMKSCPNCGCWVAGTGFESKQTTGAKPAWIGAQGCTRPGADWGVAFVVSFLGCGSAYLLGGALYMRSTGQHGWLVHRHFWDEIGGLVEDGMAFSRGERSGYGTVGAPQRHAGGGKKKKSSSKSRFAGGRSGGEY